MSILLVVGLAVNAAQPQAKNEWDQYEGIRWFSSAKTLSVSIAEQLRTGQYDAVIAALRFASAAGPDKAELSYEALRQAMMGDSRSAAGLLGRLAKDTTAESATMQAEILLLAATIVLDGNDYKPKISGLTDDLAARAAALLDHTDIFVRGIAEWAIAVKINRENDGSKMQWPRRNPPSWYVRWDAVKAADLLDCDYVRQAVQQNVHRTAPDLLDSSDEVLSRTERTPAATATASPGAMSTVRTAHAALRDAPDLSTLRQRYLTLRHAARKVVLCSPDLDFDRIIFAKRRNHLGQHNIANYAFSPSRVPAGCDVLIKKGFDPASPAESLLKGRLGEGNIRGMDLYYDADRVAFAFSHWPDPNNPQTARPTQIHEMNVDGTGLRKLSNDDHAIDREPAYLPNGDVVVASDRGHVGSECGPWDQNATALNLYRLGADGKSARRLTYNKDFDAYPHVLNDGTIGFLRWDYQERHFYYPHGLWAIRPDGTGADLLFKGHVSSGPHSMRDAMPTPCSNKLWGITCGHHALPEGALVLLDPMPGVNTLDGLRYVTPFASETEGGYGPKVRVVADGGVRDARGPGRGGYYHTSWPLSQRSVLVGADYHHPNSCAFAIYYVDVFGNKELIHRDRLYELAHPLAIKARPKPPMLPERPTSTETAATCYIADVYEGLPDVKRGEVKHIRILTRANWVFDKTQKIGELRWMLDQGSSFVFSYWSWAPTRVIGTVPVEADGSAHFKVPPRLALSFQALDGKLMEVRRMRSHVEFQPGEVRGCAGCHETRPTSPESTYRGTRTLAMVKPPAMPTLPPWGDRVVIDFPRHVQPVFDKHCASCHGEKDPKAGLEFTSRTDVHGFTQAYRTLFGIRWGQPTPAGDPKWFKSVFPDLPVADMPKEWYRQIETNKAPGQLVAISNRRGDAELSMPYQFGSHKSKVITALFDANHKEAVKMSPADWEALVTWADANAPYSGRMWYKHDPATGKTLPKPRQVEMVYPSPWEHEELNGNGRPILPQ